MGFNLFNTEDSLSCQFCKYTAYFYLPSFSSNRGTYFSKSKILFPVNNSSGLFFVLINNSKCFVPCIQCLLIVIGGFSGGSGDEEAATTPFFFQILYHFYRILSLYSWQGSRRLLSEFSESAYRLVTCNPRQK